MTYPLGIDVSHWNGPADWQKVKASGVKFVFIRAGSITDATGVCYADNLLKSHYDGVRSVGLPFGFYFYMRPKWYGANQAAFFSQQLETLNVPSCTPWVIDVEAAGADKFSTAEVIWDFLSGMASWLEHPGIIYTRQSFWDANVEYRHYWGMYDLWAARYNTALTSPWSDDHFKFRDWDTWKFWQFTDKGNPLQYGFPGAPAGASGLDLNYFNGTEEELAAYFGQQYEPPTPSDPSTGGMDDTQHALATLAARQKAMYDDLTRNFPEKEWTNIAEVFK